MAPDDDAIEAAAPDDPIAELADLEAEPTTDLPARVRRTIARRSLGRDLAGLYWMTIADVVKEWLSLLFSGDSGRRRPDKGEG